MRRVLSAVLMIMLTIAICIPALAEEVIAKNGSSGDIVTEIQSDLKLLAFYSGGIDGKFASQTATAVRAFQESNHIKATGIVDTETYRLIKEAVQEEPGAATGAASGETSAETGYSFMGLPWETIETDYESFFSYLYDKSGLKMDELMVSAPILPPVVLEEGQNLTLADHEANITLLCDLPSYGTIGPGTIRGIEISVPFSSDFILYGDRAYDGIDNVEELYEYEENIYEDFEYLVRLPSLYTMTTALAYLEKTYQQPVSAYVQCPAFTTENGFEFEEVIYQTPVPITSDTLHAVRKLCYGRDMVSLYVIYGENLRLEYHFMWDEEGVSEEEAIRTALSIHFINPHNVYAAGAMPQEVLSSDLIFEEYEGDFQELPLPKSPVNYFDFEVIDLMERNQARK